MEPYLHPVYVLRGVAFIYVGPTLVLRFSTVVTPKVSWLLQDDAASSVRDSRFGGTCIIITIP